MFSWSLFILLLVISIPGILLNARTLLSLISNFSVPEGKQPPSKKVLFIISTIQTTVLVAIFIAVGIFLLPSTGLLDPFLEGVIEGTGFQWELLIDQLLAAIIVGVIGGLIFIALYYLYFRPRLDDQTVRAMEKLRMGAELHQRI